MATDRDPLSPTLERPVAEPGVPSSAFEFRKSIRLGLLAGLSMVAISAIGLVETFDVRILIHPFLGLGYVLLFFVPILVGYIAGRLPPVLEGMAAPVHRPRDVLGGLVSGTVASILLAMLVIAASVIDLRTLFINISPTLVGLLTFNLGPASGLFLLVAIGASLGTIGSVVHLLPEKWRSAIPKSVAWVLAMALLQDLFQQLLRGLGLNFLSRLIYVPTGGLSVPAAVLIFAISLGVQLYLRTKGRSLSTRIDQLFDFGKRRVRYATVVGVLVVIAVLPQVAGSYISEVLDLVGLFLLMGLGLNIVVGLAGLLDLGYVAFFAVGAYVVAVLVSPSSPAISPEFTFWMALPFVLGAAALAGILVGGPVLRMRGDYLAIVTLGFGEIARLLVQSDWLKPVLGGAQGILRIPNIPVGPIELHTPPQLFYPIAAFVALAAYVSWRLQDSRVGRAWMAMREDEDVAEAMGINIVTNKLLAFVIGAMIASFSGAIFAMKIGSVFPHSFNLIFSLTVLVIIIVGGLGSLRGVALGALVIVGLPELLREFNEFRFLFYGIVLVVMMRLKPEGLLPSARRARELKEEEADQDAWERLAEPLQVEPAPTD
jgi:branched-chain amino acid transport system permease protein